MRQDAEVQVDLVTEVTPQDLQAAWQRYVEQTERERIKHPMQQARLDVKQLAVTVAVPSRFAESIIREEEGLMDFLREELRAPQLTMSYTVDESLRPVEEKPARTVPRTAKEKYLLMRELNPALEELRKRFDLRPDE